MTKTLWASSDYSYWNWRLVTKAANPSRSRITFMVERVAITPAAAEIVARLRERHGPLLFHQSGGCCDGSSPMCYPSGELRIGQADVYLGTVADCPFYMSAAQFEYWAHTHLTVDVVPGRGAGFSLEAPEGVRFLVRSRLYTEAERRALKKEGAPLRSNAATAAAVSSVRNV